MVRNPFLSANAGFAVRYPSFGRQPSSREITSALINFASRPQLWFFRRRSDPSKTPSIGKHLLRPFTSRPGTRSDGPGSLRNRYHTVSFCIRPPRNFKEFFPSSDGARHASIRVLSLNIRYGMRKGRKFGASSTQNVEEPGISIGRPLHLSLTAGAPTFYSTSFYEFVCKVDQPEHFPALENLITERCGLGDRIFERRIRAAPLQISALKRK